MRRNNILLAVIFIFVFMISATAQSQPQPPVLSLSTSGSWVNLSWTQVPEATGYLLVYAAIPFTGIESIGTVNLGMETDALFNLWEGAAFYVGVQAYGGTEPSPFFQHS